MEHRHRHRPSDQSSSSSPTDGDDRSVAGDEYSDPEGICVDEHGSERGLDRVRFHCHSSLRISKLIKANITYSFLGMFDGEFICIDKSTMSEANSRYAAVVT